MTIKYTALTMLFAIAGCAATPAASMQTAAPETPLTVEVMVLGTYHMGNPGADLVNAEADDVLAPARQIELIDLSRRLAAFQPTAIMVETQSPRADLLDEGYLSFEPADLSTYPNEITQVAYRLANQLGITRVYGVDTQSGEIDFFPFDKVQAYEEQIGDTSLSERLIADIQAKTSSFGEDQKTHTIAGLLAIENNPTTIKRLHNDFYYGLFALGDANSQPGAQLNYGWYARNALTFNKVAAVTQPGDRVVLLFGSGHAYWLRHFAENSPGFSLVEPVPYLVD